MWHQLFLTALLSVELALCINVTVDNLDDWYPDDETDDFTKKCFKGLGCFDTGPPFFDPIYRSISVPPQDNIDTKFYLFTQSNENEPYDLKPNNKSLENSNYQSDKLVKVILHGYENNYTKMSSITEAFLKKYDYNLILVDYSDSNGPPAHQAIANARVVGAQAAQLLHFLMNETGLKPKDIHCIGNGLGGQICGYIGERIKKMGRITGLDPEGPFFQFAAPEVRLDPSDAEFVDIIHTNAGFNAYFGIGITEAQGHVDFFPNGGNHQPGCDHKHYLNLTITSTYFGNLCSHYRSNDYFASSIGTCKYTAKRCSSYIIYKMGLCDKNSNNRMGLDAWRIGKSLKEIGLPEQSAKFYLDTDKDPPYCDV